MGCRLVGRRRDWDLGGERSAVEKFYGCRDDGSVFELFEAAASVIDGVAIWGVRVVARFGDWVPGVGFVVGGGGRRREGWTGRARLGDWESNPRHV